LSNLDAKLRAEVRLEIRSLQQRLGLTTLMVTHDREEALTMADRLVVMESGRVRQIGTPRELYDSPKDAFVADFVGRCNILAGRRENATQFRTDSGLLLPVDSAADECKDATAFALRPERIALTAGGADGIQGRLKAITYMGAQTEYVVAIGAEALVVVQATPGTGNPLAALRPDDTVFLQWDRKAPRLVPQTLARVERSS
jgi:putative spermidine/putrescine transport system ATP-binding protein